MSATVATTDPHHPGHPGHPDPVAHEPVTGTRTLATARIPGSRRGPSGAHGSRLGRA